MIRGTWVFDAKTGALVPRDEYWSRQPPPKRGDLACPHVIGDSVEVVSMVDGKTYTSKSELRRSYREKGYVEVGNERLEPKKRQKPDRAAIEQTIKKAAIKTGFLKT